MKFVLIALAVVFLAKALRHRRRYGRSARCIGSRSGRGRGRGHRGSRSAFARSLSHELDLSPEQEAIVREQWKLARARWESLDAPSETRRRVAEVMRSETYDENLLGELFVHQDDVIRTLRLEAVERLAAVHEALSPAQREKLAELIIRGVGPGSSGPYRGL